MKRRPGESRTALGGCCWSACRLEVFDLDELVDEIRDLRLDVHDLDLENRLLLLPLLLERGYIGEVGAVHVTLVHAQLAGGELDRTIDLCPRATMERLRQRHLRLGEFRNDSA